MPESFIGTYLFWCMMALPLGPTVLTCMYHAAASPDMRWILAPIGSILASFLLSAFVIVSWSVAPSLLTNASTFIGVTGGIYLMWMGYRLISQTRFMGRANSDAPSVVAETASTPFRDGFWVSASNPKVLAIYATILGPKLGALGVFSARSLLEIGTMLSAALTVYFSYGLGAYVASRAVPQTTITDLSRVLGATAFCVVGLGVFTDAVTTIY